MDFLKSCGSGILTLNGWTTFTYESHGISSKTTAYLANDPLSHDDPITLDALLAVEAVLLEQKYIVLTDTEKCVIWVFGPTAGQGDFARGSHDLDGLCENRQISAHRLSKGIFKSTDLASQNTLRRLTSAPGNAPLAQEVKNILSTSKPLPLRDTTLPIEIYSRFLSGLANTLSFRLASQSSYFPLSANEFVYTQSRSALASRRQTPTPLRTVRTSLYLTTAGVLVLSIFPSTSQNVLALEDLLASGLDRPSIPLVLSPIYCVMTYARQCGDEFDDVEVVQWRDLVVAWLERKAIKLLDLDKKGSWVRVQADEGRSATPIIKGLDRPPAFIWPAILCFAPAEISAISTSSSGVAQNFTPLNGNHETSNTQNGYSDPLSLAETWSQNTQARERLLAARRLKKKEQVMTQKAASLPSPVASRPVAYGETHGVNGVYPTPPDGLSSQQPALPGALEQCSSQAGNPEPRDAMEVDIEQDHVTDDAVDDLFDDMDEDDFAGNDITDADFSFFDQADGPGNILGDVLMKSGTEDQKTLPLPGDISQPNYQATQKGEQTQDTVMPDMPGEDSPVEAAGQDVDTSSSDTTSEMPHRSLRPLDPTTVLKSLFIPNILEAEKRSSAFAPVSFNNRMDGAYSRYDQSGPFAFNTDATERSRENVLGKISISLPKSAHSQRQKESQQSPQSGAEVDDEDSDSDMNPAVDAESTSDNFQAQSSDAQGNVSAQDFAMTRQDSPFIIQPHPTVLFRKLVLRNTPLELSSSKIPTHGTGRLEIVLKSQSSKYLANGHARFDRNFVLSAQTVTEQIVYSTFGLACGFDLSERREGELLTSFAQLVSPFFMISRKLLGGKTSCSLLRYVTISDTPIDHSQMQKQAGRPMQPKGPTNSRVENTISGNPIRFPIPFLRIRRNDSFWDMLPPAVAFWDILGLGPTNGPKNISAYTIFPASKSLESVVNRFINDLGQCYESSKLGSHSIGNSQENYIPWDIKADSTWHDIESAFQNLCTRLGLRLATVDHENKVAGNSQGKRASTTVDAFVIYVLCPFTNLASLATVASGFTFLIDAYRRAKTPLRNRKAEVFLQILPLSLVAKDGEFITPDSHVLQALAREVYNRCPLPVLPDDAASLPIVSGTSIQLAEALPRKIAFELASEAPLNIMHDPSHFHLGYARSASGNWITAAYSDNAGKYQTVTSYCLTGTRSFLDVAKEVWQTCVDIMRVRKVNWRLCIARAGYMPLEELEAWTSLSAPQQPFPLITLVTSVELDPPLSLLPVLNLPSTTTPTGTTKPSIQTPIGTPAPQPGVSPDPAVTPAATPSENIVADAINDPDAHLVDTTDETWSIILAHRLHLLPTPYTDFHQTLSSALLIRIPPPTPTPNPFSPSEQLDPAAVHFIGVHLLSARNSAKTADSVAATPPGIPAVPKLQSDNILREFLTPLRNLALLAKVRGLSDGKAGLVPWHVLMAVRGVEGLDKVYGYERWAPEP